VKEVQVLVNSERTCQFFELKLPVLSLLNPRVIACESQVAIQLNREIQAFAANS